MIGAYIGGGEIVLLLAMAVFLVPLGLAALAFWIWMLVDAIRSPALTDGEKVAWVLVILFLHLLGGLIYFFAGRRKQPALV